MFSTPLGLLALLGLPAVVALHLYQRRFPRREVSALFLWRERDQSTPSGRRRQPLVRSPSFWCELLAALLLGLALGGPVACGSHSAEHLVVVLDSSASMAARPAGPGSESLAARARQAVEARLDELPFDARVSLIASGPRPRLLAGPAALLGEARAALAGWSPGLGTHDPGAALALATELAGEASVLFVSDHLSVAAEPGVELLAVGEPADNLAITAATRTRLSESHQLRLEITVQSFASRPTRTSLQVAVTDAQGSQRQELRSLILDLAPLERTRRSVELPDLDEPLLVTLGPDALELDNQAWLVREPERPLALATTLTPALNFALGLASSSDDEAQPGPSTLDRLLELVPASHFTPDAALADLCIAGAAAGGPNTWTLAVETPGPERVDLIGPFLRAAGDPIVAGTTLQGIVWSHAKGFSPPGRALISAGNTPLMTRDGTVFHLSLDPQRSTLTRSPDWPVLLTNLAEARRRELPGPLRVNLRTTEELHFRVLEPTEFRLSGPGGLRLDAEAESELLLQMPTRPGLYQLEHHPLGSPLAPLVTQLSVNLYGGGESDLRGLDSGRRPSQLGLAAAEIRPTWPTTLLLLGALLAVALDGLVLAGVRPSLRPKSAPAQADPWA